MTPDAMLARGSSLGLQTMGFADHLWLDPRRGSRPSLAWILRLREALATIPAGGPRRLVGAETDCAPGLGAAGGEGLRALDFVVAAYHFADVREGLQPWPGTTEDLAACMLAGFRSLLDAPGVTIAGHPFFIPPSVFRRLPEPVRDRIGDAIGLVTHGAGELLTIAAARGVAFELNARALGPWSRAALLPVIRIARECGCRFALSSDAHRLDEIGLSARLSDYLRVAGIGPREIVEGDAKPSSA
jgi:histidinol phosphatase-like PHP family hydrolase